MIAFLQDSGAGFDSLELAARITPVLLAMAALCFLVAVFGALAGSCLAVYSPTKLQNRVGPGQAGDALVHELERRDVEYRVVARFYLLGGLVGSFLAMESAVDAETRPWAMAGLGILALFVCGALPGAIADRRAEPTLLRLLPVLRGGHWILRWPVVLPVLAVTSGTLRVLRIREEAPNDPEEIAEEVMAAVADSMDDDTLADDEKAWIGNIVALKEEQVSRIMVPRPDLVAIQADTPLREAAKFALEHGFSRYPVFRSGVDEVVGVFHVKDTLRLLAEGEAAADQPVSSTMRPPMFVPESMGVAQLLRRFQTDKTHLAIVLDEYGTTAGVVSVEDVIERIVGDIDDEYDEADLATAVTVVEPGRVVEVPGRTPVDELNQLLGTDLPEDGDYETVAGLVIHHLNRIPHADETVAVDGLEFHVLQADDRRVDRLRVAVAPAAVAQRPA